MRRLSLEDTGYGWLSERRLVEDADGELADWDDVAPILERLNLPATATTEDVLAEIDALRRQTAVWQAISLSRLAKWAQLVEPAGGRRCLATTTAKARTLRLLDHWAHVALSRVTDPA